MRQFSLREFRTRGSKALQDVPQGETVLLAGQQGPAYFLVPVLGDVVLQDRELRRAMAKASLRKSWRLAEEPGLAPLSDEEIDREVAEVRTARQSRKPE
jgi:antitoxin (DNA-binding transcriptional repressor) of toxin-antitoxin stability system